VRAASTVAGSRDTAVSSAGDFHPPVCGRGRPRANQTSSRPELLSLLRRRGHPPDSRRMARRYNSGEASKVAALYADGASYLTQHFATGIVEGRKNIQAYVQRGIDAHYHIDSIEVLKVNCACSTPMPSLKARLRGSRAVRQCNFAYAIARYQSTNAGRKAVGVNLIVLRKFQNEWGIASHEAAVPDPATAIQKLD